MGKGFGGLLFVCLSAFVTCSGSSFADSPETSGKTVTVYVGSAAGSGYDAYARFFARHLGRHLPGRPSVVVANMPGANSIACANFLYNVAPKDGSALAILLQNVAEGQVIGHDGIRYDAAGFG